MKCKNIKAMLSAYVDSEIVDKETKSEIEKHLNTCDECQTEHKSLLDLKNKMKIAFKMPSRERIRNRIMQSVRRYEKIETKIHNMKNRLVIAAVSLSSVAAAAIIFMKVEMLDDAYFISSYLLDALIFI